MLTLADDSLIFPIFKTQNEIVGGARIARKFRLGVSGWSFFDIYNCLINDDDVYDVKKMAICFEEEIAVGVAIAFESVCYFGHGINIGCFVRKEHRRRKIGSRLVQAVKGEPEGLIYHEGIDGSLGFWRANGGECGLI